MKALKVDFIPQRGRRWALGWAAVVSLCLVTGHQAVQVWALQRPLHEARTTLAKKSATHALAQTAVLEARAKQAVEALNKPYAKDALLVAAVAGFPIEPALHAIESVRLQGIRVAAVDLSPADGSIQLDLEFVDHEFLMRYLDELNAGEPSPRWQLMQARSGAVGGAAAAQGKPGQATIGATWRSSPQQER